MTYTWWFSTQLFGRENIPRSTIFIIDYTDLRSSISQTFGINIPYKRHTRAVIGNVVLDLNINEQGGERHGLVEFISELDMTITWADAADWNDAMTEHFIVLVGHRYSEIGQLGKNHLFKGECLFFPIWINAVSRDDGRFTPGIIYKWLKNLKSTGVHDGMGVERWSGWSPT